MTMQLTTNVLGSFVLRDGKLIKQRLFKDDTEEIAKNLKKTEDSYIQQEKELITELIETDNKSIETTNPIRFQGSGLDIRFTQQKTRTSVYSIAQQLYLDSKGVDDLIRRVNRALVRASMKEIDSDQIIIQAVDSIDDIDEAINRLVERLREWYSLHFPELDNIVSSHSVYVSLVCDVGQRSKYPQAKLGFDQGLNEKIKAASQNSIGIEFTQKDQEVVKTLAEPIRDLYGRKDTIEAYISEIMQKIAPNVSEIAGPLLGARLISIAHGLKRLSLMPAGTIQILGAEDAFFRFLKTGKDPPKHGIIFQHPDIRGAKRETRGKLSRTLAAKIAIASKVDAFKGEFIAPKLKEQFQKRVRELTKQ